MPSTLPTIDDLPLVATLRNGKRVTVREIQPDDKEGIEAAFARLSADARYSRFFSPMRQIPEQMLDALSHPVRERELALAAVGVDEAEQRLIGGARYVLTPDADSCEFAVTVADDRQGLGLARLLMQTLIDCAKVRGVRQMEGFVLSTNSRMRGLARRLGFSDAACPGDATLRIVSLRLG